MSTTEAAPRNGCGVFFRDQPTLRQFSLANLYQMHLIPTLIIGGGLAGASLACALAERGLGGNVTIVDVDLFGRYGSSATSAGGVQALSPHSLETRLALRS